jgi:hypothetical protein
MCKPWMDGWDVYDSAVTRAGETDPRMPGLSTGSVEASKAALQGAAPLKRTFPHSPWWHRSWQVCSPHASRLPHVPPHVGAFSSHFSSAYTALPQGQLRRPSNAQPPQGPAWQTLSHAWRPHPSGLPQTAAQWKGRSQQARRFCSAPHSQVKTPTCRQVGCHTARQRWGREVNATSDQEKTGMHAEGCLQKRALQVGTRTWVCGPKHGKQSARWPRPTCRHGGHSPSWQTASHAWPQSSRRAHTDWHENFCCPQRRFWRRLPQWQAASTTSGQGAQGPGWQSRRQVWEQLPGSCRPQSSPQVWGASHLGGGSTQHRGPRGAGWARGSPHESPTGPRIFPRIAGRIRLHSLLLQLARLPYEMLH